MRRFVALAVAITLAVALPGCQQPPPRPTPQIAIPTTPAELRRNGLAVEADQLLSLAGNLPALLVLRTQDPGGSPRPQVAVSDDGHNWVTIDLPDWKAGFSATKAVAAATETNTAVVVTAWGSASQEVALYESDNRRDWAVSQVPAGLGGECPVKGAVFVDKALWVLCAPSEGAATLWVREGSDWRSSSLESLPIDTPELMAHDGRGHLVITGAVDANHSVHASVSTDGGQGWSAPVVVAPEDAALSGLVALPSGGFVGTGAQSDASAGALRPAAWFSADGQAWTPESVAVPDLVPSVSASLGRPTLAADGRIAALGRNGNSGTSTAFVRTPDGVWSLIGKAGINNNLSEDGLAVAWGDRVAVVLGGNGWLRAERIDSRSVTPGTIFAVQDDSYPIYSLFPFGDQVLAEAARWRFTATDTGWSTGHDDKLFTITAEAAVPREPMVDQVSRLGSITAGAADGQQLVLGSYFFGDSIVTTGFASTDGVSWTQMRGFPDAGFTDPLRLTRVADTWFLTALVRTDASAAWQASGSVFTSTDGLNWTAMAGDFSGAADTYAWQVCGTEQDLIAVGSRQDEALVNHPMVWRYGGGRWTQLDLGETSTKRGEFLGCTAHGSRLLVNGNIDDQFGLWNLEGDGLTPLVGPSKESWIGSPVVVAGGVAAVGAVGPEGEEHPVIWLSRDGLSWQSYQLPSVRPGGPSAIAPLGDDLVVAMPPHVGDPVSVITNLADLMSYPAPSAKAT